MFEFWTIVILLVIFACPICSAIVAGSKQRDVTGWFIAGLFFGPFGLLAIVGMPRLDRQELRARQGGTSDKKICPLCAEAIRAEAVVCRYCHAQFEPG